ESSGSRGDLHARYAGDPGLRAARWSAGRRRQPARGPGVRMARPAHPVGLSGPVARDARLPFTSHRAPLDRSLRALRQLDLPAVFGLAVVALFVLAAAFAPLIEPQDPL